jgi:hypothetical protein
MVPEAMTEDSLIVRAEAAIRESERLRRECRERFAATAREVERHERAVYEWHRLFRAASRGNLERLPPANTALRDEAGPVTPSQPRRS